MDISHYTLTYIPLQLPASPYYIRLRFHYRLLVIYKKKINLIQVTKNQEVLFTLTICEEHLERRIHQVAEDNVDLHKSFDEYTLLFRIHACVNGYK